MLLFKTTRKDFPDGLCATVLNALRFTYCSLASTGAMYALIWDVVEGYRNFCNKLWNAARYVLLNTEDEYADFGDGAFPIQPCR